MHANVFQSATEHSYVYVTAMWVKVAICFFAEPFVEPAVLVHIMLASSL